MLERNVCEPTCESCNRSLTERHRMLTMKTPGGTRHAYECSCNAVTITVVSESPT